MSTVSLTKKNFNGGEWSPDLWHRSDIENYASGNKTMLNMVPRVEGGIDNRAGTHMVQETKFSSLPSRVEKFVFSTQQAYVLEFGNLYVRVYMNDGIVVNLGVPVEIVTPYIAADVALLKFEQSADVLTITHPSYPPAELSRSSHISWTYTLTAFAPTQLPPTGLAATGSPIQTYGVTAAAANQTESVLSNTTGGANVSTLTWVAPAGAQPDHYNIYVNTNGTYYYIGKTDGSVLTFTTTAAIVTAQNTQVSPPGSTNPFVGTNNYPGVSAYYGGRRVYARTNNSPQTLFGSVIGDYPNMNFSSPVKDSDAYQFTINSRQVNEIRWLLAGQVCVIGTSGGEWLMQPGSGSTDITPTSVNLQPQSNWGVSDVPPILIGYNVLFVEGSGKVVRSMTYSIMLGPSGGYDGLDVSILARHLFVDSPIIGWDYQQYPPSAIWAVRQDGVLCGLTYYAEHKVAGWHRHVTQGAFESVTAIPLPTGDKEVWFIVNRTIGGVTKRFVERMDNREFDTIADAFFVDCGLSYSGAPATTFSGIDHLDGQTVAILADGNVVPSQVVVGGTVSIPNAASTVCIGLPYTCQGQILDLNTQLPGGAELASNKRTVTSITVALENTRELFVGPSFDRLIEIPFRTTETLGQPTALFTGEKENISLKGGNRRSSSVCFQTVSPVPLSINALTAHITYGDQ